MSHRSSDAHLFPSRDRRRTAPAARRQSAQTGSVSVDYDCPQCQQAGQLLVTAEVPLSGASYHSSSSVDVSLKNVIQELRVSTPLVALVQHLINTDVSLTIDGFIDSSRYDVTQLLAPVSIDSPDLRALAAAHNSAIEHTPTTPKPSSSLAMELPYPAPGDGHLSMPPPVPSTSTSSTAIGLGIRPLKFSTLPPAPELSSPSDHGVAISAGEAVPPLVPEKSTDDELDPAPSAAPSSTSDLQPHDSVSNVSVRSTASASSAFSKDHKTRISIEIYSVIASAVHSTHKKDIAVLEASSFSTINSLASDKKYTALSTAAAPTGSAKHYDTRFDTWNHVLKLLVNVHNRTTFVRACEGKEHECDFLTCPLRVVTSGIRYKHAKSPSHLKADLKRALTEFIRTHVLEEDHPTSARALLDATRNKSGRKEISKLIRLDED